MRIEWFRKELEASGKSPVTIIGYITDLTLFEQYLKSKGIKTEDYEPTKDDVRDYIFYLKDKKMAAASIKRQFAGIRRYFLHQDRYHELNLIAKTIIPKQQLKEASYLTLVEIQSILDNANVLISNSTGEVKRTYLRDKMLFYTFFLSGLRKAELIQLKIEDVDFVNRKLDVSRAKRAEKPKVGFIPLNDEDLRIFGLWLRVKPKSEWLFPGADPLRPMSPENVWLRIRNLAKSAGIEHVFPHKLRHSSASLLLQSGVPLSDIAAFLGHQTLETTNTFYAHISDDYIKRNVTKYRDSIKF